MFRPRGIKRTVYVINEPRPLTDDLLRRKLPKNPNTCQAWRLKYAKACVRRIKTTDDIVKFFNEGSDAISRELFLLDANLCQLFFDNFVGIAQQLVLFKSPNFLDKLYQQLDKNIKYLHLIIKQPNGFGALLKIFPSRSENLYKTLVANDALLEAIFTTNLELIYFFGYDGFSIFLEKILSTPRYLPLVLNRISNIVILLTHNPEEKNRIFSICNYCISLDFLWNDFMQINNKMKLNFLQIKLLRDLIYDLINYLLISPDKIVALTSMQCSALVAICPSESQALIEKILSHRFPNVKCLNPVPFVLTQKGQTCGYYSLTAIQNFHALRAIAQSSSAFFFMPRNCTQLEKSSMSLRKYGKSVLKIPGIGGIFTSAELLALIKILKLDAHELTISNAEEFAIIIKHAIDANIPLLLPYDHRMANGAGAHYATVVGYQVTNQKLTHVLISHQGGYELHEYTSLFKMNEDLNTYPKTTFVKTNKEYIKTTTNTLNEKKFYTYPAIDLKEQLRNRIYLIPDPSQFEAIAENVELQKILAEFCKEQPLPSTPILD